ncbi:hypothetical protein JCM6882_000471 [Rhodosporidiobolus microsporus]
MELPLPNEILTEIFAVLQDSPSTLKSLCLVSRGFAHVARPFLYASLPLPFLRIRFRDRPGSGLVLDPAAYARFAAVTSDEASTSLKRAVKVVRMSGGGERAGRREYPERLEWTPESVLATLLDKCDNFHGVRIEDPLASEVVEALGILPSNPQLTTLYLDVVLSSSSFTTLVGEASTLTALYLSVPGSIEALDVLDLPSLPSLRNLTLVVQHSGVRFGSHAYHLRSDLFDRAFFPCLNRLNVSFVCGGWKSPYCCDFWAATWSNPGPQLRMLGALPRLCKEAGVYLFVEGRELVEQ